MTSEQPTLSLVIPCFNESSNLHRLTASIDELVPSDDIEIVLVDNGSTDDTPTILADLLATRPHIRTLKVERNQGYGFGILQGLDIAEGRYLAWTHADMQTDPRDILAGLALVREHGHSTRLFIKGKRYGRSFRDLVFTWGMAAFERVVLGTSLWDINAQPNIFHREFFESWLSPPHDFSLDLYAYYKAVQNGLQVHRFPVYFGPRLSGEGHNETLSAKLRYSQRVVSYSWRLKRHLFNELRSGV